MGSTVALRARVATSAHALLAAGAIGAILTGCAVGPNYVRPTPQVPDYWHQEITAGLAEGEANLQTWWTVLGDEILDRLVVQAMAGNLDLRQALARIEEAAALRGIARGEFLPAGDGIGSYFRDRRSEKTQPALIGRDRTDNFYSVGIDSAWEVDVFGRIRRSVEAATAGLDASVEDYRDVLVILLADVARSYVDVRTSQARLAYAEANAALQRSTLKLTRDRNAAGLAPDLDVRQAELNLATTESTIPFFEQSISQGIHRLGVLLGRAPGALYPDLEDAQSIPRPPAEVVVGVPATLLRQRPDIRRAERVLAGETARIGVATADLYPRFFLLGTFTLDAFSASSLFTGGARAFSVGPSLRWSIFDGGRIRSNIKAQDARTVQAMIAYESTVLRALEETENALVAYVRESERREAIERSVVAAEQSVDLVGTLYRTGLTDFQNVLDMERSLAAQQDQLATSTGLVTLNLIGIYRSLGGGWAPPGAPDGTGADGEGPAGTDAAGGGPAKAEPGAIETTPVDTGAVDTDTVESTSVEDGSAEVRDSRAASGTSDRPAG